eukprot:TRINITY_DN70579_c0_g2_i2.p1 TRINITY_DN70579_c0_g2~~TRINITY_DN70579_c0_g2_i2.p1  ORF type:complete len:211 (+),score=22.46 TRINITY_DN70579_c0_g2_i2:231-863(+)
MCTRTLLHLSGLGLSRVVIAESQNFPGRKDLLKKAPGMQLVELSVPGIMTLMNNFSKKYPWDWMADIGEIPPTAARVVVSLDPAWRDLHQDTHALVAIVDQAGQTIQRSGDERGANGGNPVFSAVMRAMGNAGSTVNLRECTVLVKGRRELIDLDGFGASSMGACELFRPAAIEFGSPVTDSLRSTLEEAGINVRVLTADKSSCTSGGYM